MLALVDSHCHLDRLQPDKAFSSLEQQIKHTQKSGVSHMLNVSIDLDNVKQVIKIARDNANIFASVGVHPSEVGKHKFTVQDLVNLARHEKVIAIGETGLDYHYENTDKERQQECFRQHIQAAIKTTLPLIIHTRDARKDTIAIMREKQAEITGGVMHCFTESWEMAKQALDMGFYISFSGIITFKNADSLREVAKKVPLERVLVETDAPYLAPEPHRGKPNQPLYVKHVAEKLAQIHNLSLDTIAQQTNRNFFTLFAGAG